MFRFSLVIAFFLFFCGVFAQGVLRGKITDDNGEELIGATVVLKGTSIGASSDFNGSYSLKFPDDKSYTVVFSYISYKTVELAFSLKKGETKIQNLIMQSDDKVLEGVEVVFKVDKAKDDYMNLKAKSSAMTMSFISKETISKTGDSQVEDAMKRVTGVSSYGGFISVRGLADRYIKTTINGGTIPTLDPFTNNIKLDIIPTALIDNISINKTMSPDLPADWAGSYVSIQTKDYPEKLVLNYKATLAYNSQSSFQDLLTTDKSPTDWLGFDNSMRDFDHEQFVQFDTRQLNDYDKVVALGYGNFLEEKGINSANTFLSSPLFYNMVLVDAGYLSPSMIENTDAVKKADEQFRTSEKYISTVEQLEKDFNKEAKSFNANVPDNWFPTKKKHYFDHSHELAFGNQTKLFGKTLGFIFGLRYSAANKAILNDTSYKNVQFTENGVFQNVKYFGDKNDISNQWGSVLNLSYQLSPYNSFSLIFMPSFSGNSFLTERKIKYITDKEFDETIGTAFDYKERKIMVYQYQSTHIFPRSMSKIDINASYTDGSSNNLDSRSFEYGSEGYYVKDSVLSEGVYVEDSVFNGNYRWNANYRPERQWRYLYERCFDSRIDLEIPLSKNIALSKKIKAGIAYRYNYRQADQYLYEISGFFGQAPTLPLNESLDSILSSTLFSNGVNYYERYDYLTNNSIGEQEIAAAYTMLDLNMTKRFRISGGLRIEYSNVHTDLSAFYKTGVPANMQIRNVVVGDQLFFCNPTLRDTLCFLPSVNLVYKLVTKDKFALVSRGSYSKSLARPSLRELSASRTWDFNLDMNVAGEPDLKDVFIHNFDFRLESFFKNKDNVAIGLFYKSITNHIVFKLTENGFSWVNSPGLGTVAGLEFEGKKSFLKYFELFGNLTLMKSKIEIENLVYQRVEEKDMHGQAPYIVNVTLSFIPEKLGLNASFEL
ncbi:MAG: carboxypeptidase-like regulatory domain-containing protein [Bacteroidales bacterium]|nr:carboxypeptidase-like regulatory domain-containing protein [Bacteroidales bacterium]